MAQIICLKKKKNKEHPEVISKCFMETVGIILESWRGKLERQLKRKEAPCMWTSRRKDVRRV